MAALTPAVFHILLALAQGERHGYGILKDILEQTDGDVRLGPGTLYGTLQRLMEAGLVEEVPGIAPETDHDSRRRYYRITRQGRRALGADVERMDSLVRAARAKHVTPKHSRG
jgi:DNA-binding PadR family transcriptional regulator